jgi:hypothetical protein
MRRFMFAFAAVTVLSLLSVGPGWAQPPLVSYQGALLKNGGTFNGDAEFKFAILCGGAIVWNSDSGSPQNGDPTASMTIPVDRGVFNVMLGDLGLGMPSVTSALFDGCTTPLLRVWVDTGDGFEQLMPDQAFGSSAFSLVSDLSNSGGSGADGDWTIDGNNIYSAVPGKVGIGVIPLAVASGPDAEIPMEAKGGLAATLVTDAKLGVEASENQVIYGRLNAVNADADGRAAIYGYRTRSTRNDGAGFAVAQTNNAVTGNNFWGDVFTFGVAGYSYNDYIQTGGVIGAVWDASYWGALGYRDAGGLNWGMYTPNNAHVGGEFWLADKARIRGNTGGDLGGQMDLFRSDGVVAIQLDGEDNSVSGGAGGGIVVLYNEVGAERVAIRAQETGDVAQGAAVHLRNGAGAVTIELDASQGTSGEGWVITDVIQINGGADIAEPFPFTEGEEIEDGSVVVIDEENPGALTLSDQPYDRRVAGIVSGAGGVKPGLTLSQRGVLDDGRNVALGGRVYVKATVSNGPIKPGDMLTTSGTAGYAMRVSDYGRAQGAVIGKAMSSLDEGTGLVLVLVSLQ